MWHVSPCFRCSVCSFGPLQCVPYGIWPTHCSICPLWGVDRDLPLWHKKGTCRPIALHQLQEGPTGPGRPTLTAEADIALSRLYGGRALSHPGLGCRLCLGNSDTEMQWAAVIYSWGWATDATCSTTPQRCAVHSTCDWA